jgi:hypothetical protein
MSSSTLRVSSDDTDDWGDLSDLALVPSTSSPSTAPPLTSSSSSSGEYNAFTFSGWGGPCLGQVGSSKFCIKLLEASSSSCGIMRHGSHKFHILPDHAYIKRSDSQALCTQAFDLKTVPDADQDVLLLSSTTTSVWEHMLVDLTKGERPDWLQLPPQIKPAPFSPLALASPRASDSKAGIFTVAPNLSFESDSSTVTGSVNALLDLTPPEDISGCLKCVETKLAKIKSAWPKPFVDLEVAYLGVVSDIKMLESRMASLCQVIGDPPCGSSFYN